VTLKQRLFQYIKVTARVSFAELAQDFPEFREGKIAVFLRENLIVWVDLTEEASMAMAQLIQEDRIDLRATDVLTYAIDGHLLDLPIAHEVRDYDTPHWMPATLDLLPPVC
jgi:hypothetical protein